MLGRISSGFQILHAVFFVFTYFVVLIKGGNGREIEYMEVSHNASYDFKRAISDR